MLKKLALGLGIVFALTVIAPSAAFAARVGEPAPDFTATDSNGQVHHLSDYRGKFVVLEWTKKHYDSGNMQRLQREWTAKGVIWLTVLSSASGKQGYMTAAEENAYLKQENAHPTAALLDPTGALGHLYDAKTSPQMYVINPQGTLIYDGAIDDRPTTDVADIQGAKNYLTLALEEATAGKSVSTPVTRPYGCSVKYAGE